MSFTKCSTILLSMCITATAYAAQLADINSMSNDKLDAVMEQFFVYAHGDYEQDSLWGEFSEIQGGVEAVRFSNKKPSELLSNTIKQSIYRSRARWGGYSFPEDVDIKPLKNSIKSIRNAVYNYALDAFLDDQPYIGEARSTLTKLIRRAVTGKKQMQLFVGSDGNSFGGCAWIAIADTQHQEFLVLSSCWSE